MNTTLVIPDIHQNHRKAEEIINQQPHDKVVFLGDYFDAFHDNPQDSYSTAVWLKERMENHPEDVFLIGNHDVQYLWGVERCSGYSPDKEVAIRKALGNVQEVRKRLSLHVWVDNVLLSHAGLTLQLLPEEEDGDVAKYLRIQASECMSKLEAGNTHWMVGAGQDRGGNQRYGGLTWCDWQTFRPIPNVTQLVGHSKDYIPRQWGGDHCIDTALRHYATITDGIISVKEFKHDHIKL